jgi:hypothetical protein
MNFQLFKSWQVPGGNYPVQLWLGHLPAAQKQRGVKMRGAVIVTQLLWQADGKMHKFLLLDRPKR